MKRFLAIFLAMVMVFAMAVCGNAFAADTEEKYPDMVTIVCGYSAGGSSDFMCRTLQTSLEKVLGIPVIVEDMPGSSSWLELAEMLQTKPEDADGSRLYLAGTSVGSGYYDPENPREWTFDDFIPMASQVIDKSVICIRNDDDRFSDFKSLLEYSKDNTLLIAATSVRYGSDDVTFCEKIKLASDAFNYEIVQTDSSKENEVMFLQGSTDVLVANIGDVLPGVEAGTYKAIVVGSSERSALLPEVPTTYELGYEVENASYRGYGYPAATPDYLVKWMRDALTEAIMDPECVETLAKTGAETVMNIGDDYLAVLQKDLEDGLKTWPELNWR